MGASACSSGSSCDGDETVLDAGCGSGRVTAMLLERLPARPRDRRRRRRPRWSSTRASVAAGRPGRRCSGADLTELELDGAGRRRLLERRLPLDRRPRAPVRAPARRAAARRPARRPVRRRGQRRPLPSGRRPRVGARGAPFADYLGGWRGPWNFAGAGADRASGSNGGLRRRRDLARALPVVPDEPRDYLRTVCLGPTSSSCRRSCATPSSSGLRARASPSSTTSA